MIDLPVGFDGMAKAKFFGKPRHEALWFGMRNKASELLLWLQSYEEAICNLQIDRQTLLRDYFISTL